MEKKKVSSQFSKRQLWGCFGFVFFLLFGICCLLMIFVSLHSKIQQTFLNPELVATAKALLNVPHQINTENFRLFLIVMENYGSVGTSISDATDVICVTVTTVDDFGSRFRNNSIMYINGAQIMGTSDFILEGDDSLDNTPFPRWCAYGELQSGIHLIEFHLKDSFWGEPIHIQQWAIEID